eukprot:12702723-Prorocentrum_lima.AAC.1
MTSSLVGSEMCIRDSLYTDNERAAYLEGMRSMDAWTETNPVLQCVQGQDCLLYTSDAADDM